MASAKKSSPREKVRYIKVWLQYPEALGEVERLSGGIGVLELGRKLVIHVFVMVPREDIMTVGYFRTTGINLIVI